MTYSHRACKPGFWSWGQKVLSKPSADSFAVGRRQNVYLYLHFDKCTSSCATMNVWSYAEVVYPNSQNLSFFRVSSSNYPRRDRGFAYNVFTQNHCFVLNWTCSEWTCSERTCSEWICTELFSAKTRIAQNGFAQKVLSQNHPFLKVVLLRWNGLTSTKCWLEQGFEHGWIHTQSKQLLSKFSTVIKWHLVKGEGQEQQGQRFDVHQPWLGRPHCVQGRLSRRAVPQPLCTHVFRLPHKPVSRLDGQGQQKSPNFKNSKW
jgi:hypothetical protein